MKNKILIIGFGKMGLSHFKSFYNKDFIIHIVEKKINQNVIEIKKSDLFEKKFFIFKKIPKKQKYLLTISATQSKDRFYSLKNFFENNKTRFLLLEKFCFLRSSQFDKFKSKFSFKTKTFVNSWAYIVSNKVKLKPIKQKNRFTLKCIVNEGDLFANITHILHFFCYLNNNIKIDELRFKEFKIIKSKKRDFYNEFLGSIIIKDQNQNKLIIKTKKFKSIIMNFFINNKVSNVNFRLKIKKNTDISFYNSKRIEKNYKFPFSKITSYIFLKRCMKKNFSYLPTFNDDYSLSKKLLENQKVKIS